MKIKKILLFFCCLHITAAGFSQPEAVKHVILIGVDGMGSYAFDKVATPHIRRLMENGSWTLQARSVLPSSSAVNWASMTMGAGPELHGFTTWGSKAPDLPSRLLDQYGMFPSVCGLLRDQKPEAEIGVIYEWEGIGYLFPKQAVNHDLNCDGDIATADAAARYIKAKQPHFLFVHLHDVDSVGHKAGHAIPEYYAAVERTDAHIGRILTAVREAGMESQTVIIVTADHGGIEKGHGGKTMAEMQIPWVISGPGIKKNHEITDSVMTFDTAATIAGILGLVTPQVWIGRPVRNAFEP